jgi:hypothetical protein
MRLQFAASDAQAFHQYASTAFPTGEQLHHVQLDGDATYDEIKAAFEVLSSSKLDLLLVYMSGHGEQGGSDGGWFCLVNAKPNVRGFAGGELEELLLRAAVPHMLLIIDCCHAEAIVERMPMFAGLSGSATRFVIASSRRDQNAWEDTSLRRSILSDVLLRACSTTSTIQDEFGLVDCEAKLFPFVREQVPLLAAAGKNGAVQEPLTGGMTTHGLKLPTVASQSFGRPVSLATTIRRRVRAVLLYVAAVGLVAFITINLLLFHFAVAENGRVLVRPGLAWTSGFLPAALTSEIDTGFSTADFRNSSRKFIVNLALGRVWGFSTHRDDTNVNLWFAALLPELKPPIKASSVAFTHGLAVQFDISSDPPPVKEELFLSRIAALPRVAAPNGIYRLEPWEPVSCTANPRNKIDFTLLERTSKVFDRDLTWQTVRAVKNPADRPKELLATVDVTAYRRAHAKEIDVVRAELSSMAAYVSAAQINGFTPSNPAPLRELKSRLPTWCGVHAALALALLGADADRALAEQFLRDKVLMALKITDDSDLEDITAQAALAILSRNAPLEAKTLEAALQLVQSQGALQNHAIGYEILDVAAANQLLPVAITNWLFTQLDGPPGEWEPSQLAAVRLLSRNAKFQPNETRGRLRKWLAENAEWIGYMHEVHDALGHFAYAFPLEHRNIMHLEGLLSPDSLLPPLSRNYRNQIVIHTSSDSAAVALGRIAQTIFLPKEVVSRLASIAIARPDIPERDEIVKGLGHQWYREEHANTDEIAERLVFARSNAAFRALEVEVGCTRLMQEPVAKQEVAKGKLMEIWIIESSPEIRGSLGRLLAGMFSLGRIGGDLCTSNLSSE